MRKILLLPILLFLNSYIAFSQCNAPNVNTAWGSEYLSNVTFGTINNNSGNSDDYEDYTAQSTDVEQGSVVAFSGTVAGSSTYTIWVWVDWDQDGTFDYPSEFTDIGSTSGTITTNINVPAGATLGSTTMRVIMSYSTQPDTDGCDGTSIDYGETEDYTVNVTAPCSGVTASITKNCDFSDGTYVVEVNITDLGPFASVNITDGTTTYETAVGTGTYIITGLSTDKTISVVDNAGDACQYSVAITAACDICNDAPSLPTDECVNAPLIDLEEPFFGSTSCSYTDGAEPDPGNTCGIIDNDSWLSFIAGDTDVEIEYSTDDCGGGTGSSNAIQLSVYEGSCGSLSEIPGACLNSAQQNTTASWNFSGLTIGDTYYIRIDGYAGYECDYSFSAIDGVAITPDNDSCFVATTLTCGAIDTASNILATATDAPTACTGGGTTSKGVWYTFTGTGYELTISTDNAATNFDTEINVYEGPCGSLTCVGGDDNSGTGSTSEYTFTTVSGTEYYVYVDGNGAAEGEFAISLTCSACNANAGTWN